MNVFEHLITKIRTITPESLVEVSVDKELLEFVQELNKEQLENSTNVKGESLGEYHQNTVNIYNQFRQTQVSIGEDVKLYDTGALYDSITAELEQGEIRIRAEYDDMILAELEQTYGEFIGLNKDNVEYVSKKLRPKVVTQLKNKLIN